MKKVVLWTLFLISILFLSLRLSSIPVKYLNPVQKSGIKVLSVPEGAAVIIDGVPVGETPFEDSTLEAEELTLNLSSGDAGWSGRVVLNKGTVTIVNRELSMDQASSSGEILTLKEGNGANVISSPQDADVEVDGKFTGKTPIRLNIQSGEHLFVLTKKGFLKRSIKAVVPPGYSLGIKVDLAISEIDLSNLIAAPVTTTPKVKVLSTPTGFLRVRDKPSLSGLEVGRISPGDELILLEESTAWFKIRLPDGKEGFVSRQYAQKINQ